jgi:hypothetical protein
MSSKPRSWSQLQRRKPFQKPRERILIICEGEKTEPIYFHYLKQELRLSSAEIQIIGKDCGSAAKSVVECATQCIKKSHDLPFDNVWCLIDTESPLQPTLNDAYNRAVSYKPPRGLQTKLRIILSNPKFEFWYVLHFIKTSQTFVKGNDVEDWLKKYLPKYKKSDKTIPKQIYDKTGIAIQNSELVLKEKHRNSNDLRNCNSSTHVHQKVEHLFKIAKTDIPGLKRK